MKYDRGCTAEEWQAKEAVSKGEQAMKPDGKIQGVNVWVRQYCGGPDWCITDGPSSVSTKRCLSTSGTLGLATIYKYFPSREAALAHLRELEAKERPVIDLTTAKFGDKFKRGDGKIETYACPVEGRPTMHLMQSGATYQANGSYYADRSDLYRDLVGHYTPPRTVEVWIEVYEIGKGELYAEAFLTKEDFAEGIKATKENGFNTLLTFHKALTEGEGLAEPDVA